MGHGSSTEVVCALCCRVLRVKTSRVQRFRFCSNACREANYAVQARARVWRDCIPEPNSGCWLWMGRVGDRGYGITKLHGKNVPAHRAAWEVATSKPPGKMLVLHTCDVPTCVNPDHLFLGTVQDNIADMVRKGRNRCAATGPLPEHERRFPK